MRDWYDWWKAEILAVAEGDEELLKKIEGMDSDSFEYLLEEVIAKLEMELGEWVREIMMEVGKYEL